MNAQNKNTGWKRYLIMGLALTLQLPSATWAAEVSNIPLVCSVPVCDVTAEITTLRGMTQANRFKEMTTLRANYKHSTDIAVLKNLADVGNQSVNLFKEIHEEDWLVREAQALADDSLLGLAEYSALDPQTLASYYGQVKGEASRFQVITFWEAKIATYEDMNSLVQLAGVFEKFSQVSSNDQDPAYLSREAKNSQDAVTRKIVEINPFFEGVYSLRATSGEMHPDRMTVMNTLGSDGIEVTLTHHESGIVFYRFTNVVISNGGTSFEATNDTSGSLSELHLDLDRGHQSISGWLKSASSTETTHMTGMLLGTPETVFQQQQARPNSSPLAIDAINGAYTGTFDQNPFKLIVRVLSNNEIGVSMNFDALPGEPVQFQNVHFLPARGILSGVANLSNGGRMKIVLFFNHALGNALSAKGMAFNTLDGSIHEIAISAAQ